MVGVLDGFVLSLPVVGVGDGFAVGAFVRRTLGSDDGVEAFLSHHRDSQRILGIDLKLIEKQCL